MPASLTGDCCVPGADIGGILHKIENGLQMIVSYTIPPLVPVETPTCLYPGIAEPCSQIPLVNKHGRRFADATFPARVRAAVSVVRSAAVRVS